MNKYFVIENRLITSSTLLLTLKPGPTTQPLTFQPGQYAVISFKKNGRPTPSRSFSIVNAPSSHGIIQCSIRKKGRFTNAAASLMAGDEVTVAGPFGGFIFDEKRDKKMVLIAGGIGITPFMSMIQYATNNKLTNDITLIYSCNNQNDIPFVQTLIDIEKLSQHFRIIFAISGGPINKLSNQKVITGRITPDVIQQSVGGLYNDKTFFICGPTSFMNAMTGILYEKGVSEDKVMTEAFGKGVGRKKGNVLFWSRKVYILGAIGVVLTIATVMISDLFANLPVSSLFNSSNQNDTDTTNRRQDELDGLINNSSSNQSTPASSTQTTTSAPSSTTKSTPVCTTSQSGITTCV